MIKTEEMEFKGSLVSYGNLIILAPYPSSPVFG